VVRRIIPLLFLVATLACRRPETAATLLHRLPTRDATVLSLDVDTLRQAGLLKLLAANKSAEEPEYQAFIQNSGFDYQRDLDSAVAAFAPSGNFFLVRGRFDWKKLEGYARANGGSCYDKLCRMPGSTPERRISFLPLEPTLMALAVSSDDLAASRLTAPGPQREIEIPGEPLWLSVPAASLGRTASLPGAVQAFAGALSGADRLMLTLGPHEGNFEGRLEAVCRSPGDAKALAGQLMKLTSLLREATKTKAGDDIPALLAAGSFSRKDQKVFGYWPIRKTFIQTLAGM
jgi:hypothetical protein